MQSFLPNFLTTPLAYTVMIAVGVMAGSIVVGAALVNSTLSTERRNRARPKLLEFHATIEQRLAERLPANLSADEFEQYLLRVNRCVTDAADWIGVNLGGSARAKFLDTSGLLAAHDQGAINPRHQNIILNLTCYRKNLLSMIEGEPLRT